MNRTIPTSQCYEVMESGHPFFTESFFHEQVEIERKRSERSGKPFLLMLVDITRLLKRPDADNLLAIIEQNIDKSTREIDIKGWYEDRAVVGVIFTELGNSEKEVITETIGKKLKNNLFYALQADSFKDVEISFHWYPLDNNQIMDDQDETLVFYPDLSEEINYRGFQLYIKRSLDIIGSLTAIVIFSPIFLLIPLFIKMSSRGPVFFKQERLGWLGKKFTFLKFRSMYVNNDEALHRDFVKSFIENQNGEEIQEIQDEDERQKVVYKLLHDPRITPVGRLLRKTSLDELPQFFNVLKGDMSLVGPRPPIPYEIESYKCWHRRRIIEIKPGITGLWQVMGRSSCTFDEMVRLDLKYRREWSFLLDIKILFKTPLAVITGKGAY